MKPQALATATQWITALALQHPASLPDALCERFNFSRRAASSLLHKLVDAQWLVKEGTRAAPRWKPGVLRQVVQTYPLQGLQEDLPWARDFAPFFELTPNVGRMVQHAFS